MEQLYLDHQHGDIGDESHAAVPQQNRVSPKWLQLPSALEQAAWAPLAYNNFLRTDKFRFKMWFTIFKKHFKDLAKIFA